jgi:hypothetical protein
MGETYAQRLNEIAERWEAHCREAGHVPASEGGDAYFDRSLGASYAVCCVAGCDWSTRLESDPVATIDLTPTPEGLARSAAMFEEQIAKSEKLIADAEDALGRSALFEAGMEALVELEQQRIKYMREGIEAATGEDRNEDAFDPETVGEAGGGNQY